MRRGALRAFHHQVGYAARRLRQSCPVMCLKVLPAVQKLQLKVKELAPAADENGCDVKWPAWCCSGDRETCPTVTKRILQQHDTSTTAATEGDVQTISETESWVDGSILLGNLSNCTVSRRHHSRKPRTSRRSKSRLHQFECAQQVSMAAHESRSALGDAGHQQLSVLLECLEEDLHLDGYGDDCYNVCHAAEDACPSQQEDDAAALSSDLNADSDAESGAAPGINLTRDAAIAHDCFTVKIIKPQGVSLGLSLQQQASGLLVERVLLDGVVALWNSKSKVTQQVATYDKIVSVNGSTDSEQMLSYCSASGSLTLEVLRGPFEEEVACLHPPCPVLDPLNDLEQLQPSEEHVRTTAAENDRYRSEQVKLKEERQLAMSSGAEDVQRLLAARLERSRLSRS